MTKKKVIAVVVTTLALTAGSIVFNVNGIEINSPEDANKWCTTSSQ